MQPLPLRPSSSPDVPDVLLHMTGRLGARAAGDPVEASIRSIWRAASILHSLALRAGTTPGYGYPFRAICLTQTTRAALARLISIGRYDGVGIAFHVQSVFDGSGGPALYVRGDAFDALMASSAPDDIKGRVVRFWPGALADEGEELSGPLRDASEWTHEREWRIPAPPGGTDPYYWHFPAAAVAFLLVRDEENVASIRALLEAWRSPALALLNALPKAHVERPLHAFDPAPWAIVGGPDTQLWS